MLLGAIINGLAIIIGSLIGKGIKKMSESTINSIMQGVALVVIVMGIGMTLKSDRILLMLISLVVGGILGSLLRIQKRLEDWSQSIEKRLKSKGEFANSFVTGILVFIIGPMAILGGLSSGLENNHQILFTKSLLDGFTSIIFTSTLGIGVLFSAIPVFLYEGLISIGASWITQGIEPKLLETIIQQLTAVGGLLVIAIGLNILKIIQIPVANYLPSLLLAVALAPYLVY
ncbi:DUF554 domain-containing protein [Risungbinella massiliensis]|uniref:DUF554 domain-containing protein n=1 Tax=Risungbinella massiliensis TaxID=1329796 RepID=UPI0005CB93F6|nr:DUF554 domain-containing protein [Risungbinella massiliensis]